MSLRSQLVNAAIKHDTRAEIACVRRGVPHNQFALAQAIKRIDEVMADIDAGADPRAALIAGFCSRLLDALLKSIGQAPATREETVGRGWTFQPVTQSGEG